MRINSVQKNTVAFNSLQVYSANIWQLRPSEIKRCGQKLANTKVFDVIIDSHGFAIKEKKTDVLKRIQSFSLFPKENAVSINMVGEKEPLYKFSYKNLNEAKDTWESFNEIYKKESPLGEYTKVALWLEKNFQKIKN